MAVIAELGNAADWRGADIAGSTQWRLRLSEIHRSELLAAVASVQRADLAVADFGRAEFPLPTLGPVLDGLYSELMDGRGFTLLQGIPVDGLDERQRDILAVGIGRQVGATIPQGPGDVPLRHVRDQGVDPAKSTSRSYQHNGRLGYHSDPNDIVALLCIRPAKSGGLSTIVSSVAVHNEVVRNRPDLAEVLYAPWWRDNRSGDGPESFYQSPIYLVDDGKLSANYGPDYIRSAQRGATVPSLRPEQLAAMAELDRLNNDPRFALTMDLQAGDMQFLNNYVTMHSRTEYEDHPEPERRRDLIRLWIGR